MKLAAIISVIIIVSLKLITYLIAFYLQFKKWKKN